MIRALGDLYLAVLVMSGIIFLTPQHLVRLAQWFHRYPRAEYNRIDVDAWKMHSRVEYVFNIEPDVCLFLILKCFTTRSAYCFKCKARKWLPCTLDSNPVSRYEKDSLVPFAIAHPNRNPKQIWYSEHFLDIWTEWFQQSQRHFYNTAEPIWRVWKNR